MWGNKRIPITGFLNDQQRFLHFMMNFFFFNTIQEYIMIVNCYKIIIIIFKLFILIRAIEPLFPFLSNVVDDTNQDPVPLF